MSKLKKGDLMIINGNTIHAIERVNAKSIKVDGILYKNFGGGYYQSTGWFSDNVCRKATKKELDLVFAKNTEDTFSEANKEVEKFIDNMKELEDAAKSCKYVTATDEIQNDYEAVIYDVKAGLDYVQELFNKRKEAKND